MLLKDLGDGIRYGVAFTRERNRPVAFIDFHHHHRLADDARFARSIAATMRFKDGDPETVRCFGMLMARIAAHDFANFDITAVAPALGRNETTASPEGSMSQVAQLVAEALHAPLRLDYFRQTQGRDALHHERRGYNERKKMVLGTLCYVGPPGQNVLLVDDIFTTSATQESYADRLEEGGSSLAGAVVMMRYENDQELLNPGLFQ